MKKERIHAFEATMHTTHEWLNELAILLGRSEDVACAYSALRAVLHALRDRLGVAEAAALGAQLPLFIRGVYYDGWQPHGKPMKGRKCDAFLAQVAEEMRKDFDMNPDLVAWAVFELLNNRISRGETDKIRHALPAGLRALWPEEIPSLSL